MKKILNVLLIILLGSIFYSFGISIYENAKVDKMIKEFKQAGVLNVEKSSDTRKYYEVKSTEYLDDLTYIEDEDKFYMGNIGDILVSRESPFPEIPIIHQFISYNFGGHAAIVSDVDELLEIAGFPTPNERIIDYISEHIEYDEEGVQTHNLVGATIFTARNYFIKKKRDGSYYRRKSIGLRVRATKEERQQAVDYVKELRRKNVIYNYMFFLDTKEKYYCTDLISRAYQTILDENNKSKYSLNDDGFITSVNDLILSKDTMISTYFEVDKDGVEHVYYLVNPN
ncbi:MAG: hypothetical protein ACOX56_06260 [Acholeplasmataceae bacterium]|jgi:hypothetical protein